MTVHNTRNTHDFNISLTNSWYFYLPTHNMALQHLRNCHNNQPLYQGGVDNIIKNSINENNIIKNNIFLRPEEAMVETWQKFVLSQ